MELVKNIQTKTKISRFPPIKQTSYNFNQFTLRQKTISAIYMNGGASDLAHHKCLLKSICYDGFRLIAFYNPVNMMNINNLFA